MKIVLTVLLLFSLLTNCTEKPKSLFQLLDESHTGIDFNNRINETDSFNILTYEYIYNGGGVGIADFNNDSLPDIFFTGNQVPNKLYLNKGGFHFQDISETANVNVQGRWNSGVAIVDINNDGWMDIYVCATTHKSEESRRNMLFVNQGVDASGNLKFEESASKYKIDYPGNSIMAAFFDYDKDGDLDLYILENTMLAGVPINYRPKIKDGKSENNDRLFKNDGNGTFSDVTIEAGIVYEGFGLGLMIQDFNGDMWPDIYVSNDYVSNDILYINNGDGTFKNMTADLLGHQSNFSMGNDAADINNDGLPDFVTLDMLPESSERKKTTINNKVYQNYLNNEEFDYEYQHVRNMMHLNNGAKQKYKFSEIGQLAGVHQTEWSWSVLMADFDNDAARDLMITNGFPKDITDRDFGNYRSETINIATTKQIVDSIPIVETPNYAFKNNGDLTFTDVTKSWGLYHPSFSNGAAFGDLDNDGDLDYVVNNINLPAFVYQNNLYSNTGKHPQSSYLRVKLIGSSVNRNGVGAMLKLYFDGNKIQYHENYVYRGYLSSVEGISHFGLGLSTQLDSLVVIWPDNRSETITNLLINKVIIVNHKNSESQIPDNKTEKALLSEVGKEKNIFFKHSQKDIIDFNLQRTIPHKFSQFGPALASGDINGDGLEDFYVGGSTGTAGSFFLQQKDGTFFSGQKISGSSERTEETSAILFDADNDEDLDLYVGLGGFVLELGNDAYHDKLYINNGRGEFTLDQNSLPGISNSTSCVRAGDFDKDGDLDLFIGSRVIPGKYPLPATSYILRNEGGRFINVTDQVCPSLLNIGLITDALWTDYDNDGSLDLIITGELMPISIFKNEAHKLYKLKNDLDNYVGWWNSITGADFDQDGDIDFIVGNLGKNNSYHASSNKPVRVYAKDIDNNGSVEALLFCYSKMLDGSEKLCPIHFWDELNQQSPRFRKQFTRYKYYSRATWDNLLSPDDKKDALIIDVNHALSSYVENKGNGYFELRELPTQVQLGPVNGIVAADVNNDSYKDVLLVGNNYGNEVFEGRHDAFIGTVLLGDGLGGFKSEKNSKTGFYVPNDAKALVRLSGVGSDLIIASQNRDSLKMFTTTDQARDFVFKPDHLDVSALLSYASGRKERIEFYYGSGYLSQSSRSIHVPNNVIEIEVFNSKGQSRKISRIQ